MSSPVNKFYNRVENFSNTNFTQKELNLLNKGLKYCPNIRYKRDMEMLCVNTEIALSNVDNPDIRNNELVSCANIISKSNKNKYSIKDSDKYIVNSLKQKINSNSLVVCKADKGNTITIINRSEYIEKTELLFRNDNFKILNDPTNKFQKQIKSLIKNCPNIFSDTKSFMLTMMNPKAPVLYSLPKIHKPNCPMRPVVSYVTAPAYKVCKKLNELLPKYINFNPKYAIKNTLQLVNNIKNVHLPLNAKLVSFDVKNLFPSIPEDVLLSVCSSHIQNTLTLNSDQ